MLGIKLRQSILTTISTSQTKAGKLLWSIVVCISFLTAAYLINKSYIEWQESPVYTSSSTHSLAGLDFPNVTVCPPKGSHTALNYDLMKADPDFLTEEDRDRLKKDAARIFVKSSHEEYVKTIISTANPLNVKQIYQGFQEIPRMTQNSEFEMKMWSSSGSIQSPGFRGDYDEDHYKTGRQNLYILQFPDNIRNMLGNGSLVIDLEVNTRQEKGWQEYVHYMEGSRYKLYTDRKNWAEAESHCQKEEGHLASVTSEWEQEQVEGMVGDKHVWIGGTDQVQEGRWQWVGGADWEFTKWVRGRGQKGTTNNCALTYKVFSWIDYDCKFPAFFLCELYSTSAVQLSGDTKPGAGVHTGQGQLPLLPGVVQVSDHWPGGPGLLAEQENDWLQDDLED